MVASAARYTVGTIECVFETVVVGDPKGLGKCRVIVNVVGCAYIADSGLGFGCGFVGL